MPKSSGKLLLFEHSRFPIPTLITVLESPRRAGKGPCPHRSIWPVAAAGLVPKMCPRPIRCPRPVLQYTKLCMLSGRCVRPVTLGMYQGLGPYPNAYKNTSNSMPSDVSGPLVRRWRVTTSPLYIRHRDRLACNTRACRRWRKPPRRRRADAARAVWPGGGSGPPATPGPGRSGPALHLAGSLALLSCRLHAVFAAVGCHCSKLLNRCLRTD